MNTNKHPAPIPGTVKGKYILKNVTNGVPPRDLPAKGLYLMNIKY